MKINANDEYREILENAIKTREANKLKPRTKIEFESVLPKLAGFEITK